MKGIKKSKDQAKIEAWDSWLFESLFEPYIMRKTAVKAKAIIKSCGFVIVSAQKKKPIATTMSGDRLLKMETVVMLKYFSDVWLMLSPATEMATRKARSPLAEWSIESIMTAFNSQPK